jgi:hypothetical protein
VRVTKAALEALLKVEQQKVKALEERVGIPMWDLERRLGDAELANDLLTLELNKERERPREVMQIESVRTVERYKPLAWYERLVWFVGIMAMLLTGCSSFMPEDATTFPPPDSYRRVWIEAMACTGKIKNFDAITFYMVPGETFYHPDDDHAAGAGYDNKIFLAEAYLDHPMVVKHEMIHILRGSGHPDTPFKTPCKATWDTWDRTEPRLEL